MVMASDAHFDEFSVEPGDGDDHEGADADSDMEIDVGGMIAHEGERSARHIEPMTETEHEGNISDVVCDGIEPFAFMARAHAHSCQFAVDAVHHGRDLPEDDGQRHERVLSGGDEGCGSQTDEEAHEGDHIGCNE